MRIIQLSLCYSGEEKISLVTDIGFNEHETYRGYYYLQKDCYLITAVKHFGYVKVTISGYEDPDTIVKYVDMKELEFKSFWETLSSLRLEEVIGVYSTYIEFKTLTDISKALIVKGWIDKYQLGVLSHPQYQDTSYCQPNGSSYFWFQDEVEFGFNDYLLRLSKLGLPIDLTIKSSIH
ncbi:hypothetical protein NV379_01780 [Paenibacillus sp. N1-5-1-14]|uniref:hypothetical protein n=1 Tax=Paenibacillus radicibacter TaxID=2972488 RepID=UPI002159AB29|nr:hypothetical protein [Paenibacillus radicibacter]MCR8641375.1 hypothetical protein [Paenibacillus radicibacter]